MYIDLRQVPAEVKLTYNCDLSCPACNMACFYKRGHPSNLTTEQFTGILDDVEREGFRKQLSIVGGEPTLHPQFVEFVRLAHSRRFFMKTYSNFYRPKASELVGKVRHLTWSGGVRKLDGDSLVLGQQTVFCAPRDLPDLAMGTCGWERVCGYPADSTGYSVCTVAGMISHWQGLGLVTRDLAKINDPDWQAEAKRILCQYCGAFLDYEAVKARVRTTYRGTLMTESWLRVFDPERKETIECCG